MLSTFEAAASLGVNSARVRAMIKAGLLEANKVGGRWVVSQASVERRRQARVQAGRKFSARRAWGLLLLASGRRANWLTPSDAAVLRRRLREEDLIDLAPRLQKRATVHNLRAHPSDLRRIDQEPSVVNTGISAASEFDLDLTPDSGQLDIYAPARNIPLLRKRYALQPSSRPNLILRVVEEPWPFEASLTVAPRVVVGLDLFESVDERLRRAGRHLLEEGR